MKAGARCGEATASRASEPGGGGTAREEATPAACRFRDPSLSAGQPQPLQTQRSSSPRLRWHRRVPSAECVSPFPLSSLTGLGDASLHDLNLSPGDGGCSQYVASPLLRQVEALEAATAAGGGSDEVAKAFAAASAAAHASQQAWHASERVPLFPIFLARGTRTLHLVRHGESEYNAACGAPGSSWEEPRIFDAPLTARGEAQARALGGELAAALSGCGCPNGEGVLWVTSPLTRAIQTSLLAREALTAFSPAAAPHARGGGGGAGGGHSWLTVSPLVAEHLATSGDVGRRPAQLAADFPELAAEGAFADLDDVWWYSDPQRPCCAERLLLGATEPKDEMKRRVSLFRRWLQRRQERTLVVFGHSTFFKYLLDTEGIKDRRLKNCELFTCHL